MRIAEVIGTVTLSRWHPALTGARWKLAVPLSLDNLAGRKPARADPIVLFDELGADVGTQVMMSEGREASQPFFPEVKPIDAYNSGILDELNISNQTTSK